MHFPCQELEVAQGAFVHLLGQLKPECKLQFLAWVQLQYSSSTNADSGTDQVNEISEGTGRLGHNDKINIFSLASQPPFTCAERRGLVKCVKDPCRRGMHDVTYFWCA